MKPNPIFWRSEYDTAMGCCLYIGVTTRSEDGCENSPVENGVFIFYKMSMVMSRQTENELIVIRALPLYIIYF